MQHQDTTATVPPPSLKAMSAEALLSLRADMLRFARRQLRNSEAAEDMVQSSIEAALRHSGSFAGKSTLKSWVFAILRNRIVDQLQQAKRTVPMSSLVEDGDDWQERLETLLNERGRWRDGSRPAVWPAPEASMQSQQFWAVYEGCLEHLSANTARVFTMRECLDLDTAEICKRLGITTSNCHVMLHRARIKLRGSMDSGWGRPEGSGCSVART